METGSNSDSEGKKDSKTPEAMKKKAKGKRPMKAKTGKKSTTDSKTMSDVDLLTKQAERIALDESKKPTSEANIAARSKGKAPAAGADSKTSKVKQTENVVKSSYSLRSGPKGMDIDAKPTMEMATSTTGKKRKGGELKRLQSPETDTEEAHQRIKRKRDHDDDTDDMDGTAARLTRSSSKQKKVKSL